jgi:pyridoxine kinase
VDAVNTVTLSNRPDYKNSAKGFRLEAGQFKNILEGLQANGLVDYNAVLSGYISSGDIIDVLRDSLEAFKLTQPELVYICDPVLGDNGSYYVKAELLDEYKHKLIPLADIITPNYFEAQVLSGVTISTFATAIQACNELHALGPATVCLKGLPLHDSGDDMLTLLISQRLGPSTTRVHRLDVKKLLGPFSGCGDLYAALVTACCCLDGEAADVDMGRVLDRVASTMHRVLSLTQARGSSELCIVEAMDMYRDASIDPCVGRSHVAHGPVAGIIFDLDGTLTLAGAIDFKALYARLNLDVQGGYDIITRVNSIADESERNRLWTIIDDEERQAEQRMELQPDLSSVIGELTSRRVRLAISTRNTIGGVQRFLTKAQLDETVFSPVVSRHCLGTVNKPDPQVARHILAQWSVHSPGQVWFVGDSIDDMKCGRGAGCRTCFLRNPSNGHAAESGPEFIDVVVDSLQEFLSRLKADI